MSDHKPNPHTGMTLEEAWEVIKDWTLDSMKEWQYECEDPKKMLAFATFTGIWWHGTVEYPPFDPPEYDVEEIPLEHAGKYIEAVKNWPPIDSKEPWF